MKKEFFTEPIGVSLTAVAQYSDPLKDGGLRIGWSIEDITPDGSASLFGQYYKRISTHVQSPLKITACAIESTDETLIAEEII